MLSLDDIERRFSELLPIEGQHHRGQHHRDNRSDDGDHDRLRADIDPAYAGQDAVNEGQEGSSAWPAVRRLRRPRSLG